MKTALIRLLLAALTLPATAATVTWTGGAANDRWSDGGNWTPASPPTATDDAVFAGAGPLNVDVDGVFAVRSITFSSGSTFLRNFGPVPTSELTVTDQVTHSGTGSGHFGIVAKFPNFAPVTLSGSGSGEVVFRGGNPTGSEGVIGAPALTMNSGTFRFFGTYGLGLPPAAFAPDSLTVNGGNFCLCSSNSAKFTTVTVNSGATLCSQNSGQAWNISEATQWTVNAGGTLKFAGTLIGPVSNFGTVASGCSPGKGLLVGDLTLGAGSRLEFELAQPNVAGPGSDRLDVDGNVTLDGTVDVLPQAGFGAGTYQLLGYTGTLVDNGLTLGTKPPGYQYSLSFATAGQVNLVVTQNPPGVDLEVTTELGPDLILPGTNLTVTVTVRNNGTMPAQNVLLTNQVPSTLIFQSATSSAGSFTFTSAPLATAAFTPLIQLPTDAGAGTNTRPQGVVAVDLDGDGRLDLVSANSTAPSGSPGFVSVFRNLSNPDQLNAAAFATRLEVPAAPALDIIAADFDGDGRPDLALCNMGTNSPILILLRNDSSGPGDIRFEPPLLITGTGGGHALAVGDFNRDDLPDLVLANETRSSLFILQNKSQGPGLDAATFGPPIEIPVGSRPRGFAVGDLTVDDWPDIAVALAGTNALGVVETIPSVNLSANSFAPTLLLDTLTPLQNVIIGDFNGDGTNDLIIPANAITTLIASDLDGDGLPDIAELTQTTGLVRLYKTSTDGGGGIVFTPLEGNIALTPAGTTVQHALLADLDRDGQPDLVATGTSVDTLAVVPNTTRRELVASFGTLAPGQTATLTLALRTPTSGLSYLFSQAASIGPEVYPANNAVILPISILSKAPSVNTVRGYINGSVYFCPPGKGASGALPLTAVQIYLGSIGGFLGGGPISAHSVAPLPSPFTGQRFGTANRIVPGSSWFPTATFSIPVDTNPRSKCRWPSKDPARAPFQYQLDGSFWMTLGNSHQYQFSVPTSTFPVYPSRQAPFGCPTTLDICECPALVTLNFVDCAGNPTTVSGGSFQGFANGSLQAYGNITPGSGSLKFLARGGVASYRVVLTTTTAGSPYVNQITSRSEIVLPSPGTVCDRETVVNTVKICLPNGPANCPSPNNLNEISGMVDMVGELEHNFTPYTWMMADSGPSGNFRWSRVPWSAGGSPSSGLFKFPSLPVSAYTTPPTPYNVHGRMSFRNGNRFEYFETPCEPVPLPCGPTPVDIGDRFVMTPGCVKGNIKLCGPCYCDHWLQYLYRDQGMPAQWSDLSGSSHVPGYSSSGCGRARTLFAGHYGSDGCNFTGDYELVLAGLNGQPSSSWSANQLVLRFLNPVAPGPYLNEGITITDNLFPSSVLIQTNRCLTNNHNYCFGEVTLTINSDAPFSNPSVSGSGSYIGSDCDGSPADYSVGVSASGEPTGGSSLTGQIRMVLPAGTYTLKPTVQAAGGSYTLNLVTFTVKCGECITINSKVELTVANLSCVNTTNVLISGTVVAPEGTAQITYSFNGGAGGSGVGCTGAGCAPTFSFIARATALNQGQNTVKIEVTDKKGNVASVTQNFRYDSVPPVLSGCTNIQVIVPPGQATGTTTFNVTANDAQAGVVPVICNPPSRSVFPLGCTTVTCKASDDCHNTNTCTFEVCVLSCVGILDEQVECIPAAGQYLYSFTFVNALNFPAYSLLIAPKSGCASAQPVYFPLIPPVPPGGTYSSPIVTMITVGPNCPAPVCFDITARGSNILDCCTVERCLDFGHINCPGDITVDCDRTNGAFVNWDVITGVDYAGYPLIVTCSRPPGFFPVGVTPVTCAATDACGNEITCTFTVCVRATGTAAWQWAKQDGGSYAEAGQAIATDPFGKVLYGGSYSLSATTIGGVVLPNAGGQDGFLAKRNEVGAWESPWAFSIGGTGNDEVRGIATDRQGNVYVTGTMDSSVPVKFTHAGGSTTLPLRASGADVFLAKYAPNGTLLWATRPTLAPVWTGSDIGTDVTVDSAGKILVTGRLTDAGITRCFLLKYDPTGLLLAGPLTSTGAGAIAALNVTTDAKDDVYITGFYVGTPKLFASLPSANGAFVAKADKNLTGWTWNTTTTANGSSGTHDGRGIGVDPGSGDVFITGYFNGTATMNATPGGTVSVLNTKASSRYDYYVARLDPINGLAKWIVKGNGPANMDDETRDLAVDMHGTVYVTGFLSGLTQFSDGGQQVLVASYNGSGQLRWTRNPVVSATTTENIGRSLAVDCGGCVHVTGNFEDSLMFPNPPGAAPVQSINEKPDEFGADVFVAKLCGLCDDCHSDSGTLSVNMDTGYNQATASAIPVSQSDDQWQVCQDAIAATTEPRPAVVVAPPGSYGPGTPAAIGSGVDGRWTACYCFCLADGFSNPALSLTVWSSESVMVYLNDRLIGSAAGTPLLIPRVDPTYFYRGQNCIEIVCDGAPVAVKGLITADHGRCCATICGTKWNDLIPDGIWDGAVRWNFCQSYEPGLANWTIQARDSSGNVVGTAVTDRLGNYCIGPLPDGIYTVCEVQRLPDWLQVSPPALACHTVNIIGGISVDHVDFGNRCQVVSLASRARAGRQDNFLWPNFWPEPATALAPLTTAPGAPAKNYDDLATQRTVRQTFANLPKCDIVAATLIVRMKPTGAASANDTISMGLCGGGFVSYSWTDTRPIAGAWASAPPTTFTIPITGPLLAKLAAERRLDVMIGEDTVVDWMTLEVSCCGTSPNWRGLFYEAGDNGNIFLADGGQMVLVPEPGVFPAEVKFHLTQSRQASVAVPALFPANAGTGTLVRLEAIYDGGTMARVELQPTGSRLQITADLSQLDALGTVVRVFNGGTLVATLTNRGPGLVTLPLSVAQTTAGAWSFYGEPGTVCSLSCQSSVAFTLADGRIVTGNLVTFGPTSALVPGDYLTGLTISTWGTPLVLNGINSIPARDCSTPATLQLRVDGGDLVLNWEGEAYQLQISATLPGLNSNAGWTNIPGNSPVRLPRSGAAQYFRLICR